MVLIHLFVFLLWNNLIRVRGIQENQTLRPCFQEGSREFFTCNSYLECQQGDYVVKHCKNGEMFDLKKYECIVPTVSTDICKLDCNFHQMEPVRGSNSKYFYCENGKTIYGECDGYFDRVSKRCKSIKLFEQEGSNCIEKKLIPVKNSCTEYLECDSASNKRVRKKCPDCQNFEPESMKCVWAWKYYCDSGTSTVTVPTTDHSSPTTTERKTSTNPISTSTESSPSTTSTSEATTLISSTSTSTTSEVSTAASSTSTSNTPSTSTPAMTTAVPSECTSNGSRKVFKKGDCKNYLECDSGKWIKKSCAWGDSFDINKLECRFSWWAKC